MLIGHFAVGFASKKWAPRANLAWLLLAPLLDDVIWPVLILAGVEHARVVPDPDPMHQLKLDDMPWSHSLLMNLVTGALLGLVVWRLAGGRAGVVAGIGVVSHWVLDLVSHTPDMALAPGGTKYGFDLWASVPGTIVVELLMFAAGLWLYASATKPKDGVGRWSLWAFAAVLPVCYFAGTFAPTPADLRLVAVTGIVLCAVSLAWAVWIERHREAVRAMSVAGAGRG